MGWDSSTSASYLKCLKTDKYVQTPGRVGFGLGQDQVMGLLTRHMPNPCLVSSRVGP